MEKPNMTERQRYNPPQPVRELLPVIDAGWRHWLDSLARVPSDRIAEPGVCGDWSIKDLMGHVAFWDKQVIDDIDAYVANEPPLTDSVEGWNQREAHLRAGSTAESLSSEMHEAHARMLQRLTAVAEIDPKIVAVDTWEHYAEHSAEIERWLSSASATSQ
jgi:hypothetical protein